MQLEDMIQPNEFVQLQVDNYQDKGVKNGDVFYVAGLRPTPIDQNDLYLQRIFILVHPTNEEKSVLADKIYLMDPRDFTIYPETDYMEKLYEEFGEVAEVESTH